MYGDKPKIISHDIYTDERGNFTELINNTKNKADIQQISLSFSKATTLRGMHCSPYAKIVKCLSGHIIDTVVNVADTSQILQVVLRQEDPTMLYIPPGWAHGFYALYDSTVQYLQFGHYDKEQEIEFNCQSPLLAFYWPKGPYIQSEKDKNSMMLSATGKATLEPEIEYAVMGHTGFLGQHVVKVLEEQKLTYYCMNSRLESLDDIRRELKRIKPRYVICAAGAGGRPNIDWCERHKSETVMANVVGQLNMAQACKELGIHCTLFGSGVIFNEDRYCTNFDDNATGNFSENFYTAQRLVLEQAITAYPEVLLLRIMYPITAEENSRNFLDKLMTFPETCSTYCSYTIIDTLFPFLPEMSKRKLCGVYNFVNPGESTHFDIRNSLGHKYLYGHSYSGHCDLPKNRSCAVLSPKKLLQQFPEIPNLRAALNTVMCKRARVLIFGATGMLGRYVCAYFEKQGMTVERMTSKHIDLSTVSHPEIEALLREKKCKFVVNCAGLIKQRENVTTQKMFAVNTNFPIMLAAVCKKLFVQLIHPSTDCIFSGKLVTGYDPDAIPDAQDIYGKSKALAETIAPHAIIIRTSIIGEENINAPCLSLLEWCRKNINKTVKGYTTHYWNGITCLEWAKYAFEAIQDKKLNGIYIPTTKSISKCELIRCISEVYNLNINVEPVKVDYCNKTLIGKELDKNIEELLKEMRNFPLQLNLTR